MLNELEFIKKLRNELNLPILECKKAIKECGLDFDKIVEFLRKNGQTNAIKKSSRETKDGIISYQKDENYLVFIKLLCETDFVAKNSIFLSLAKNITSLLLKNPTLSIEELILIKDLSSNQSLQEKISETIMKTGENILLEEIKVIHLNNYNLGVYLHNKLEDFENGGSSKILTYVLSDKVTNQSSELQKFLNSICMHIAASSPSFLNRSFINDDTISKEREIYQEQLKNTNKPQNVIDKIIDGKLEKFFSETCLNEQAFIIDPNFTVEQSISNFEKNHNLRITLKDFAKITLA